MTSYRISLLIPSTSKNNNWQSFKDTFINSILLKSFLETYSKQHEYCFYFGFDVDDKLYNDDQFKKDISDFFLENEINYKIINMVDIAPGHLTKMWNVLFENAYDDGNNYFLQCGDDIYFNDVGWVDQCIKILKVNKDIGVTAPMDIVYASPDNRFILTQAFVSRKHMEIFRYFFPAEIKNWCCDDWITEIYRNRNFLYRVKSTLQNLGGKQRYDISYPKELKNSLVNRDVGKLDKYKRNDKIGIVITTFNSPEYLKQTFDSLKASELNNKDFNLNVYIIIVDDGSTDKETLKLLHEFKLDGVQFIRTITQNQNQGVYACLKFGLSILDRIGCDILLNLYSDILVKPNFLTSLLTIFYEYNPVLLTGYNSVLHTEPFKIYNNACIKRSCGAVNMLFSSKTYNNIIRAKLIDIIFDLKNNIIRDKLIDIIFDLKICKEIEEVHCTIPSVIQHIGLKNDDKINVFKFIS